jgi:hypothetical protein
VFLLIALGIVTGVMRRAPVPARVPVGAHAEAA